MTSQPQTFSLSVCYFQGVPSQTAVIHVIASNERYGVTVTTKSAILDVTDFQSEQICNDSMLYADYNTASSLHSFSLQFDIIGVITPYIVVMGDD